MDLNACRRIALTLAALGLLAPAAAARPQTDPREQGTERADPKQPRMKEPGAVYPTSTSVPGAVNRSTEAGSGGQGTAAPGQAVATPRSDRQLASEVRRSILKDDTLSDPARHVNVDVQDGMVSLKGTVRSEAEKSLVEQKAAVLAGADRVRSEVTVDPQAKF